MKSLGRRRDFEAHLTDDTVDDVSILAEQAKILVQRHQAREFWSRLFVEIESHDKLVKYIVVSSTVYSIMRTHMMKHLGGDLEESDYHTVMETHLFGILWTAGVYVANDNEDMEISLYDEEGRVQLRKDHPTLDKLWTKYAESQCH